MKALSKKIDSSLIVNVALKVDSKTLLSDLAVMPENIVIKKVSLPLCTTFREYFGFKSINKKGIDLNLGTDPTIKTFSKIVDCYDTLSALSDFWKAEVM